MAESDTVPNPKRLKTASRPQLQNGYECIFVSEPPQHLQIECSICLCVLQDPHIIDCQCGSSYCLLCIQPLCEKNRPCPLCNCSFTTQMPNPKLKRTLNGLLVYCSFKEAGSGQWRGELGDLKGHLTRDPVSKCRGCKFVDVECFYCENKFKRCFIEEHENSECSKRIICCDYCGDYESTFEDIKENHVTVCPSRPVSCPNVCGEMPLYKDLSEHLATSCPLQVVDCCFSYAGCEAKVLRRDIEAHVSCHAHVFAGCQSPAIAAGIEISGFETPEREQQTKAYSRPALK